MKRDLIRPRTLDVTFDVPFGTVIRGVVHSFCLLVHAYRLARRSSLRRLSSVRIVNSIVINCSIEIKCFLVQPLVLSLPSVRVPFEASSRLLLQAFLTT